MAAWHRFWCVNCQRDKPIGERTLKTVYNGSTKRVKVMCGTCGGNKRKDAKAPYVEDDDTFTIPQNIVDSYLEQIEEQ